MYSVGDRVRVLWEDAMHNAAVTKVHPGGAVEKVGPNHLEMPDVDTVEYLIPFEVDRRLRRDANRWVRGVKDHVLGIFRRNRVPTRPAPNFPDWPGAAVLRSAALAVVLGVPGDVGFVV